jgi:Ca2+-binding EF-hand superfamily protein
MSVDQNLLKLSWQLFDKNGTGMITPEEVGMFLSHIFTHGLTYSPIYTVKF